MSASQLVFQSRVNLYYPTLGKHGKKNTVVTPQWFLQFLNIRGNFGNYYRI